jgi:hypothetical protein
MLHKIGALFPKKSKDGKDYLSGVIFQNQGEEDGVRLLAFKSESKAGKTYYTVNIPLEDGRDVLGALQALRGQIESAIEAAKNEQGDEIDMEDVETF